MKRAREFDTSMFSSANTSFRGRKPALDFDHYKKFADAARKGEVKAVKQQLYFGFETAILDKFENVHADLIRFKDAADYRIVCPC